jgi:hypothetical protein
MNVEKRSKGLPKREDLEPFSRDIWITERDGISRARAARTGQAPRRMFGRRRLRSFFGRASRS